MSSYAAAIQSLSEQQHTAFLDHQDRLFISPVLGILEASSVNSTVYSEREGACPGG